MKIDEAIKHAEEVAEENEKFCFKKNGKGGYFNEDTNWDNKKCAKEHRQLAEWLKEYQRLRKAIENIRTEISDEKENQMKIELECVNVEDKYTYLRMRQGMMSHWILLTSIQVERSES